GRYRDVGVIVPVALQLWLFASPVMYPMELVPARWRMMYYLNPLAGVVDGFHVAVGGGRFNWTALGMSTAVTLVVLAYALRTFVRSERSFADVI
ncbi:MAG TPA: ABC transporter permease, partial [Gemmatirosa sp.]